MKYIYLCGPTVYDDVHIGNIRPLVILDIYLNSLKYKKEEFTYIQNITDIDDKIIDRAKKENVTEEEITNKYTNRFIDVIEKLKIMKPNHMPTVVKNIDYIIDYIDRLVKNNNAYEINGNVYFDTKSIDGYGKLANINEIEQTTTVDATDKKNENDFALWKKTDLGIKWDSPWGKGRPGWHTECSAFIDKYANHKSIDLHVGGIDLKFPHHVNEDAQYVGANGVHIAKEWFHIGHLNFENQKMSKSLGNIKKAKDIIAEYGSNFIKLLFFNSSPTAPLDLNAEIIKTIKLEEKKLNDLIKKIKLFLLSTDQEMKDEIDLSLFVENINNFNFSNARKNLNDAISLFNKNNNLKNAKEIIEMMKIIGFDFELNINQELKQLYKKWNELKKSKNWDEADKIRDILLK
ncbi:MAG: cysteine--tRNA ligase [Mycoplasma sp.]|nr:cysteine--tRNA ligase [Mycoplasma sp.]